MYNEDFKYVDLLALVSYGYRKLHARHVKNIFSLQDVLSITEIGHSGQDKFQGSQEREKE